MKRFRFTLLVVCLLLGWLGFNDLSLQFRNRSPETISLRQLLNHQASQEWVRVTGGYQNLDEAISTSGTLELNALLVPLKGSPEQKQIDILIETRDPEQLSLFSKYHFQLESAEQRKIFRKNHADRFFSPRPVTGMITGGLVADNNRDKLEELASQLGLAVSPGVIFIAEGKQPAGFRGYFFLGAAVLGLLKFASMLRSKPGQQIALESISH